MAGAVVSVGRYALRHEIAAGGMAVVHLGRLVGPAGFSRTVAIKRLHPHLARNPEFVAMFLDEARLAARIRHPNVVSTLDVVATDGELFVVMEYVPGDSLARLLGSAADRGERATLPVAASIMVNVLHGLHAAHEACDEQGRPLSLVHRDVSPHNILVGTDGLAHLIDFGVAKAAGRAQVTREGQLKGKLAYMAPEQLRGKPVDRRADVFGAAVVFWEMLTGARLFEGADEGEIYGKVMRGDVQRPSRWAGDIGRTTDAIVLRGLARNPARRYESARAMALAIESALPLAPASHVGKWVEGLRGEMLAERQRQIAEIERELEGKGGGTEIRLAPARDPAIDIATSPGGPRAVLDEAAVTAMRPEFAGVAREGGLTDTSLVASEPAPRGRSSRRGPLVGAALLVVAAAGAVASLRGSLRGGSATSAVTTTMPRGSAAAKALTVAAPAVEPPPASAQRLELRLDEPTSATLMATASPPLVSPADLPVASAPAPVRALEPRRRPPPSRCTPPYTIDANGYKRYKRECASW
jgi:serine/threonine-protein kinase